MKTLKTILVLTFYVLVFVGTLGLVVPYLDGKDPPVATIERKYRIRGWLLFLFAWLFNTLSFFAFSGWNVDALFPIFLISSFLVWLVKTIGYDANPNHFEYM